LVYYWEKHIDSLHYCPPEMPPEFDTLIESAHQYRPGGECQRVDGEKGRRSEVELLRLIACNTTGLLATETRIWLNTSRSSIGHN